MNDLIENISEQLKQRYPQVAFEINAKGEMTIFKKDADGFDILVQPGEREHTLHFGNWHFHFDNNKDGQNELLDYLGFGMSTLGRLKAYSKNGKEYKWQFEMKQEESRTWYPTGTMAIMNFQFWLKPKVNYYQNDFIQLEEPGA